MRRTWTGHGTALLIAGLAGALAACNGWPHAGEDSVARNQPEKYPSYAAVQGENPALEFDGRHWVVSPGTVQLIGARLQPVGNAGNFTVYAEPGARTPYAVLYAPAGGTRWRRVMPIE